MSTQTLETTMFDNEISILYKWARLLQVPVNLIIAVNIDEPPQSRTEYIQGPLAILDFMNRGLSLNQIANELSGVDIDDLSIVILYAINALNDLAKLSTTGVTAVNNLPSERNSEQTLIETINTFLSEHGINEIFGDIGELQIKISEWSDNLTAQFKRRYGIIIIHGTISI